MNKDISEQSIKVITDVMVMDASGFIEDYIIIKVDKTCKIILPVSSTCISLNTENVSSFIELTNKFSHWRDLAKKENLKIKKCAGEIAIKRDRLFLSEYLQMELNFDKTMTANLKYMNHGRLKYIFLSEAQIGLLKNNLKFVNSLGYRYM